MKFAHVESFAAFAEVLLLLAKEHEAMLANLTALQKRSTEMLLELRALRAENAALKARPAWADDQRAVAQ